MFGSENFGESMDDCQICQCSALHGILSSYLLTIDQESTICGKSKDYSLSFPTHVEINFVDFMVSFLPSFKAS